VAGAIAALKAQLALKACVRRAGSCSTVGARGSHPKFVRSTAIVVMAALTVARTDAPAAVGSSALGSKQKEREVGLTISVKFSTESDLPRF